MTPDLQSRTAFVTGGASGIGAACATALRGQGANVAVLDVQAGADPDVLSLVGDVTSREAVDEAVAAAAEHFGGIDIVVNCAGIPCRGALEDTSDDEWLKVLDVNVVGMARVIRAALPHLRRSAAGAVVNLGSVSGAVGLDELPIYSASKGAIAAMTRALANDLVGDGIRVNCVSPGTVHTPWMDRVFEAAPDRDAAFQRASTRQPIGRMISADEVAAAVVFLAGTASSGITGIEMAVDGGMARLQPQRGKE